MDITPPHDYAELDRSVKVFARHCLDRYDLDEKAQWYYEVWNEPNIIFRAGSQEDCWKFNDASTAALKAVSPHLRLLAGSPLPSLTKQCAWPCRHRWPSLLR